MRKILFWLLASAAIMLALPWLAVTFIKGDGAMAVCFLLFFALDPICAICAGAAAGKNVRKFWMLPVFPTVLFLAGSWLLFDMGERAFLLYALIYLLLGLLAMLIFAFIKKHAKTNKI